MAGPRGARLARGERLGSEMLRKARVARVKEGAAGAVCGPPRSELRHLLPHTRAVCVAAQSRAHMHMHNMRTQVWVVAVGAVWEPLSSW
jgi:hypothetical protein